MTGDAQLDKLSLQDKLDYCTGKLSESSKQLRKAIVDRNVDAIWESLAEQEEFASRLEEFARLWQDMHSGMQLQGKTAEKQQEIRKKIIKLQGIQRTNAMLAQSFLSAVRRAMGQLGQKTRAARINVYNRKGRVRTKGSSFLINKKG